ncbi:hypothetical protein [Streptomyces dysideae]|uniref:Uncharacterized protein n=1 Tax=Streptomyces dysideae TaxID=909626 RepID=A0A101UVZ8_9ACTN|nr:hypothetical protein [Streptomyces dysideae]KUO17881.1 hypothetical protein AQJ91_27605 [Streptomyces dysideae]
MLALRLTRGAHPVVQLRRLLVAAAAAGTGFLLLCALGHAIAHPDSPGGSVLRLAWCLPPLATTVYFAVAVARTDPGTRPRPGLSAIGLGPARVMAFSATTTALSCTLGSILALLFFLHLRGDLTGMPFDGAAADFLAADRPLPLPAALTLLGLLPATASLAVAVALRPREARPTGARTAARSYGRFGAYGRTGARETYGRFGAQLRNTAAPSAGSRAAGVAPLPQRGGTPQARASDPTQTPAPTPGTPESNWTEAVAHHPTPSPDPTQPPTPRTPPSGLPWSIAVLTAGLAVEAHASRDTTASGLTMPAGLATGPATVLAGWLLTALGLTLAAPGLTHLCGRLLQSVRPGARRLLAGRVLMEEATRIGRPLGVVCVVASAAYAMATLSSGTTAPSFGPLTTLGATLVTGCTVATLLTAAVEAKHARADTTAALLRLGAPATMLRSAAALRAGALLAMFGPLTLLVAELAAVPLAR